MYLNFIKKINDFLTKFKTKYLKYIFNQNLNIFLTNNFYFNIKKSYLNYCFLIVIF